MNEGYDFPDIFFSILGFYRMNEPKTAAMHNMEHGGFYGHDFIVDDSALLAFEKLKHKRRVKKTSKWKPKKNQSQ